MHFSILKSFFIILAKLPYIYIYVDIYTYICTGRNYIYICVCAYANDEEKGFFKIILLQDNHFELH